MSKWTGAMGYCSFLKCQPLCLPNEIVYDGTSTINACKSPSDAMNPNPLAHPLYYMTRIFGNHLNLIPRTNQHGLVHNAFERTSLPCMYPRCTFWVGFVCQTRTYLISVLQLCGRYLIFLPIKHLYVIGCVVRWRSRNKHCKDTYLKVTRLRLQVNHSTFNSGHN